MAFYRTGGIGAENSSPRPLGRFYSEVWRARGGHSHYIHATSWTIMVRSQKTYYKPILVCDLVRKGADPQIRGRRHHSEGGKKGRRVLTKGDDSEDQRRVFKRRGFCKRPHHQGGFELEVWVSSGARGGGSLR